MPRTGPNLTAQARQAAIAALINAHKGEFETLYREACEKAGVKYPQRTSAEERQEQRRQKALAKARKQMEQIVKDFPELAPPAPVEES